MYKYKILLIEDNIAFIKLIQKFSEKSFPASQFTAVDNLAESLKYLQTNKPDIILLDLSLDDSEGIATFKSIKYHAPESAVIILSNTEDRKIILQLFNLGIQDYLMKDFITKFELENAILYSKIRFDILREKERQIKDLENTLETIVMENKEVN